MLISDTAGMGKSTVLTQLSKQIKQKFPKKWVVRIDINDHTDALNTLQQKHINKEKAVEFVSEKLLKFQRGVGLALFKECCEEKQKVKIVIMVDGFDEISPDLQGRVIDMLQVLKQTSLEQLWVTSRTHLREKLEENLQQLSYTLQPFSEEEQVEFLKNFWTGNLNTEVTNQDRLQIFAKLLIRKLSQSISDKDKEFTGIPLQTRMLAEAFEEKFISFYESQTTQPELPHNLDLLGLYRQFIDSKYDT